VTAGDDTRGCYVYGIVRDAARPSIAGMSGVGGAAVDFVRGGSLAAVVADVERRHLTPPETGADAESAVWLEAVVRAHEHVLERCFAAATVLPMRFATTFRAAGDVQMLLLEREREFVEALSRLDGRREWGLKAGLDPVTAAEWARQAQPELAEQERSLEDRTPGAAYFDRKRLEQQLAAHADDAVWASLQHTHARLSDVSTDTLLLPQRGSGAALNAAYLVSDAAEADFHRLVDSLQGEHASLGIRYRVSGPWPPYNFVAEMDIADA